MDVLNGTDRQVSTTSMTALTDIKGGSRIITTVIPIREEFRCRRAWFFYHDIRALVTSWLPLPVFLVWKLLMTVYIFIWLILHINARNDRYGARWLIYITNLAYLLLNVGTISITILTVWYTILYYRFPDILKSYLPRLKSTSQEFYSQDNIPWFAKLCWALYIVGASLVPLVVIGYWTLSYKACPAMMANSTNSMMDTTTLSTPTNGNTGEDCSELDAYSIHLHAINLVIIILDIILNRVPFQFMHFFYPLFFMIPYVIFTVIFWAAGGLNPINGMRYVYDVLHYRMNETAPLYAILLIIAPMPIYLLMFLVVWLRDVISAHVSCCFRDISSAQTESSDENTTVENGTHKNGTQKELESTKL